MAAASTRTTIFNMSEQDQPANLPPLYSLTAIGIATFLGSFLAGGYMLASNYIALGKRRLGMYTIYASLALLLVFVVISAQVPQSSTGVIVMTMVQVVLALLIANKLQGPMFASFEQMGGEYHSLWRAVLIGLVASLIALMVLVVFVAFFGIEALPTAPVEQ
jgi:hypothetical protein